jgi:hypothetical protein
MSNFQGGVSKDIRKATIIEIDFSLLGISRSIIGRNREIMPKTPSGSSPIHQAMSCPSDCLTRTPGFSGQAHYWLPNMGGALPGGDAVHLVPAAVTTCITL